MIDKGPVDDHLWNVSSPHCRRKQGVRDTKMPKKKGEGGAKGNEEKD